MEEADEDRVTPEQRAFRRRLGVTLKEVRTRLTEYTQESIAEVLGVDKETVGRWERGYREPTAYKLAVMAEKYQLPDEVAAWFLFPTDSLSELDRRIEGIRAAQLRRAAAEAAALDSEGGPGQPGAVGGSPRRGKPRG